MVEKLRVEVKMLGLEVFGQKVSSAASDGGAVQVTYSAGAT